MSTARGTNDGARFVVLGERGLSLAFLQASTSKRLHTWAAAQASNRFPLPTPHIPLPPTAELAPYEADMDYRELEFNSV